MHSNQNFEASALRGRSRAVYLWSYLTPNLSDAHRATLLTVNAVKLGLIPPRKSVPGNNLRTWRLDKTGEKVQLWVAISAIDLLTTFIRWVPETEDELAIWATSQVRQYPLLNTASQFDSLLPTGVKLGPAKAALQAALGLSAGFRRDDYRQALDGLSGDDLLSARISAALDDKQGKMTDRELSMTVLYSKTEDDRRRVINECREMSSVYLTRSDLQGQEMDINEDIDESTIFVCRQGTE